MGKGIQDDAAAIGAYGCYFLCLLKLVGRHGDALGLYYNAQKAGAIDGECWVANPGIILALAAGGAWDVHHAAKDYQPERGEQEILRYERKTSAGVMGHFVVGDGTGKVQWDPKGESQTVKLGRLVSKRIVRRTA